MAFLDWMKERGKAQQPAAAPERQTQKPETAKEMYNREAAQEQAGRNSVERMPEAAKREAVEAARPVVRLMEKATQHRTDSHDAPASPNDSKEAMVHNQGGLGKSQKAMSPTDSHNGRAQGRARGIDR